MVREPFSINNTSRGFVRGFWWHARMDCDAVFSLWTPQDVTRKQAMDALLEFAQHYEKSDITSLWKTIKQREMI